MTGDARPWRSAAVGGATAVLLVGLSLAAFSGGSASISADRAPAGLERELTQALLHQDGIRITPLSAQATEGSRHLLDATAALARAFGTGGAPADSSNPARSARASRGYAFLVTFTDPNVGHEVNGKVPNPQWDDVPVYAVVRADVETPSFGPVSAILTSDTVSFVNAYSGRGLEFMSLDHPLAALHRSSSVR
jgi:hypothetical protein